MYTVENLQSKTLNELKEIGWELNTLPTADRRCRQNWIDAIAGVNPPLLQLLEDSPVVEAVPEAIELQAQEPIERAPETPPGVNFDPIEVQAQEPLESKFGLIIYPKVAAKLAQNADGNKTDKTNTDTVRAASVGLHHSRSDTAQPDASSKSFKSGVDKGQVCDQFLAVSGDSERDRRPVLLDKPTELTAFTEADRPPNRGDNGRDRLESEPEMSQGAIAQAAKTSPGVKSKSTAHQLLELFKSSAHIIPDSPADEEVTESAIGEVGQKLDRSWTEVDPNPILTGCPLSPEFLARYSPPPQQIIQFQSEPDGQLSLLNFVESTDEPPDPDDFPSIDAFREAMARWDAENAEALAVSNDSMCEWAPCPHEWYEPEGEILPLKPSSMIEKLEVNPTDNDFCKCWNFSIPTFDAWCDRANRQGDTDEPPDTGIYARLPKPKPPSFPPTECFRAKRDKPQTQTKRIPNAYQTEGKRILIANQTTTSQPARSPPGGDAHL